MILLVLGLLLFLGIHSVSIVAPAWRDAQVTRRGEGPWKGVYSLLSIAGFALLVYGYGVARQSPLSLPLYTPPHALRHVALLLMLPVFPLLFAAYLPGRIKSLHCKDWAPGRGYAVLFGEGTSPWARIFKAAESGGGVEYYLIEQEEGPAAEQLQRAERCLANWKRLKP